MPKTGNARMGPRCLLVRPAGGGTHPVARALAGAGLTPVPAGSEAEALELLDGELLALGLVSQAMGPVAVGSVVARAGHSVMTDNPDGFRDAVAAFVLGEG